MQTHSLVPNFTDNVSDDNKHMRTWSSISEGSVSLMIQSLTLEINVNPILPCVGSKWFSWWKIPTSRSLSCSPWLIAHCDWWHPGGVSSSHAGNPERPTRHSNRSQSGLTLAVPSLKELPNLKIISHWPSWILSCMHLCVRPFDKAQLNMWDAQCEWWETRFSVFSLQTAAAVSGGSASLTIYSRSIFSTIASPGI